MIPTQYTCAAPSPISSALQWSNPPAATASFATILHDKEGDRAKGTMDTTHWIFWNVPASSVSLPPYPPPGATPHHYVFEMYALLDISPASSRADLLKAMEGHVIGKAIYFGLFGR